MLVVLCYATNRRGAERDGKMDYISWKRIQLLRKFAQRIVAGKESVPSYHPDAIRSFINERLDTFAIVNVTDPELCFFYEYLEE